MRCCCLIISIVHVMLSKMPQHQKHRPDDREHELAKSIRATAVNPHPCCQPYWLTTRFQLLSTPNRGPPLYAALGLSLNYAFTRINSDHATQHFRCVYNKFHRAHSAKNELDQRNSRRHVYCTLAELQVSDALSFSGENSSSPNYVHLAAGNQQYLVPTAQGHHWSFFFAKLGRATRCVAKGLLRFPT